MDREWQGRTVVLQSDAPAMKEGPSVRCASWEADREAITAIRRAVFVQEQGIPEQDEFDEADRTCIHFLAQTCGGAQDGAVLGTARLLPGGRIGRVAVLREARGKGVGRLLVEAAMAEGARRGITRFQLSSQVQAQAFYASLGFHVAGDPYMEDGIPHILMERTAAG